MKKNLIELLLDVLAGIKITDPEELMISKEANRLY